MAQGFDYGLVFCARVKPFKIIPAKNNHVQQIIIHKCRLKIYFMYFIFQTSQDLARTMSYAEDLVSLIRESCTANCKELEELWITMGLGTEEIDERMETVRCKVRDITTEMVECDRGNKMMIEEACNNLKKEIQVLRMKLKITGDPEPMPSGLALLEMLRKLKLNRIGLEEKIQEIMLEFR